MTDESEKHELYYTSDLVTNLQLRWGEGFLSPGGESELARMLQGHDLYGKSVIDFGCGVGGYDVLLVKNHEAARVVGVDIDAAKLNAARALADAENLGDRLEFVQTQPGPLPFENNSFDVAFSKDSIIELPEKNEIFRELFRVVRPGGLLVISDWFRSNAPYTEEMREWATTGDETYEMDSISSARDCILEAGFIDAELDDRNDWFRVYSRDEYERLKGSLYQTYVEKFGEEQARTSVENARIRALLADQGQLRPGHIRARK
jgi:SAM-dependent methyltransferase